MTTHLSREHLHRYADIVRLVVRHGRSDLVAHLGAPIEEVPGAGRDRHGDAIAFASDLEDMGPAFVKFGQLLSTRADLLPPEYLVALARLQDNVDPLPFSEVAGVLALALGAGALQHFSSIEETPLAAASLGQVHRGTLRDGRLVAVKVLRPHIEEEVARDLEVLQALAEFADQHSEAGRRLGFGSMVEEFARSVNRELDYREEAGHLVEMADHLSDFERIVVPRPELALSDRRVLTMEFVAGRKVTSLTRREARERGGPVLAEELFRAYLEQVLLHGFFHADPHPGNVFLADDGRLALLDLGMVARITPSMRDSLLRLLAALGEDDADEAVRVAQGLGEPTDDFDRAGFVRDVEELLGRTRHRKVQDMQAGAIVADLTRAAATRGMRPAPELSLLGKAMLNLDQVAHALDPDFDPKGALRSHISSVVQKQVRTGLSGAGLASAALDVKEFAERLPGRVNRVMDALAEGQLTLRVEGIDDKEIMRSVRKLANRLTMGVVLAALIIGAAMLVDVETNARLFGYPAVAIVCFLAAAAGGLALLVNIVVSDRRERRRQ